MPNFTHEDRNGHLRTTVTIQPGEKVKLCRCMKSKEFPLCDGTHKTLTDTNAGPVIVQFDPEEVVENQPKQSA